MGRDGVEGRGEEGRGGRVEKGGEAVTGSEGGWGERRREWREVVQSGGEDDGGSTIGIDCVFVECGDGWEAEE